MHAQCMKLSDQTKTALGIEMHQPKWKITPKRGNIKPNRSWNEKDENEKRGCWTRWKHQVREEMRTTMNQGKGNKWMMGDWLTNEQSRDGLWKMQYHCLEDVWFISTSWLEIDKLHLASPGEIAQTLNRILKVVLAVALHNGFYDGCCFRLDAGLFQSPSLAELRAKAITLNARGKVSGLRTIEICNPLETIWA